MKVIQARNVHQALPEALYQLRQGGESRDSRNGPVLKFDGPVSTLYERPEERVMFWAERNANPFFHLIESLWMLGGRNDVAYLKPYVARMATFSDDGQTLHGAYGHRWRRHFGFDQLDEICAALRKNPDCRRQVLSMWDAGADLGREGKDLPCNLLAVFGVNSAGALDMMVTNRSNDIIWGAYGANAVHFSYLLEYVARRTGFPVGRYWQVSFNFHAYLDTLATVKSVEAVADGLDVLPAEMRWAGLCPYNDGAVKPFPLMQVTPERWEEDLAMFLTEPEAIGLSDPFFRRVAVPVWGAWAAYKSDNSESRFILARERLKACAATDWKLACSEWLDRAHARYLRARDDGPQPAEG